MKIKNLFSEIKVSTSKEIFDTLIKSDSLKLERIVSSGQSTPTGKSYDQETNEWVILLKGSAGLLFKDETKILEMYPGDFVNIPAHKLHRIEWTDTKQQTVWLALHY